MLLTASRVSEEKKANPGYRAFFANGFNVTRSIALVAEVVARRASCATYAPAAEAASIRCCAPACASSFAT